MRWSLLVLLLGAGARVGAAAAVEVPPAPRAAEDAATVAALSDAEKERFLSEGKIVKRRSAPGGITNSERATLALGELKHDAHIQRIDEHKVQNPLQSGLELDFRDSWKGNVAAYRLDRLLGLGMVPVTVERHDGIKKASFTWWVDDVLMDEKARRAKKVRSPDVEAWNRQMYVVRIFDQLIYNFDRNLGNLLIDGDWRIWMIDHSRAFKNFKTLKTPSDLGARCPRGLLAALRRLEKDTLKRAVGDVMDGHQIDGLLARRDVIVRHYEDRIAREGEDAVLYDLPSRLEATAALR